MVVTLVFPLGLPPKPVLPGGGVDYLFTCPHGPDPLTSSSQLISSRQFNINPEGSGGAPRVPGADTLCRTSEGPGCLAAWPWLLCLALCTASMVRRAWELGQAGGARRWAHGQGSPYSTENPEPASRWASAHGIQLREGVWCPGLAGWDYFSLAIWRAGWG